MRTVKEYYLGAFSADNLFGFRMIISFSSLLILLCIFLAPLVWRAKSKGFENKFMSVLLVCEGIKASFIVSQTTPYIRRYEWLQDILWHWTIDVFFTAHITGCNHVPLHPDLLQIESSKFHAQALFKKHAFWHIAPALGIAIWLLIRTVPEFYVSDATWVVCEEGEELTTDRWFGENETGGWKLNRNSDTGNCTASYETTVTTQPPGLWAIALGSPLVSLLALFFIRSSIKSYKEGDNPDISKSLTSRSLYIGFLQSNFVVVLVRVASTDWNSQWRPSNVCR